MNTAPSTLISRGCSRLPNIRGIIERRLLVNYRCEPEVLARLLPAPFKPRLVHDFGMAGICLIRLGAIRPAFMPALGGLRSENAAHRIAVEWEENGSTREGVYIPRRDTNSFLNQLAGGRLFPGLHHAATFRVWESGDHFKLEMRSEDDLMFVRVLARVAQNIPRASVFESLGEASAFFEGGAVGWSPSSGSGAFDGLELHCDQWSIEPLAMERVQSSFFENRSLFPGGAATFDSAFLMRNIPHEWRAIGRLRVGEEVVT